MSYIEFEFDCGLEHGLGDADKLTDEERERLRLAAIRQLEGTTIYDDALRPLAVVEAVALR